MPPIDIDAFESAPLKGPSSTVAIPPPAGETNGTIKSHKLKAVNTKEGEKVVMDVVWELSDTDGKIQAITGREKNFARQSVWIDLDNDGRTDESDGMNIGLGRLRDAIGQNEKGKKWSYELLDGAGPALLTIKHEPRKDDAKIIDARVDKVAALGSGKDLLA